MNKIALQWAVAIKTGSSQKKVREILKAVTEIVMNHVDCRNPQTGQTSLTPVTPFPAASPEKSFKEKAAQ